MDSLAASSWRASSASAAALAAAAAAKDALESPPASETTGASVAAVRTLLDSGGAARPLRISRAERDSSGCRCRALPEKPSLRRRARASMATQPIDGVLRRKARLDEPARHTGVAAYPRAPAEAALLFADALPARGRRHFAPAKSQFFLQLYVQADHVVCRQDGHFRFVLAPAGNHIVVQTSYSHTVVNKSSVHVYTDNR